MFLVNLIHLFNQVRNTQHVLPRSIYELMSILVLCWPRMKHDYLKPIRYEIKSVYRNLPNKGAGRSSKVISNNLGTKLTFLAFQRWFRIENRTNIKETMAILVIFGTVVFFQT